MVVLWVWLKRVMVHSIVGCLDFGLLRLGCGLLKLVGLVEISVGHGVVGCPDCGLLRLGYGLLKLVMGLVEIGMGHGELTRWILDFRMVGLWFFSVLCFFFFFFFLW